MSTANSLQHLIEHLSNRKPRSDTGGNTAAGALAFTRPEAARALDAMMIVDAMVAHGDIVRGEDGSEHFSFPLSALIGDILGAWRAESENDEDDGISEHCHRTSPREMPPRLPPVPASTVRDADLIRPALVA